MTSETSIRDNEHIAQLIRFLSNSVEDWTEKAATERKRLAQGDSSHRATIITMAEGQAEGFRRSLVYLNHALHAIEQDQMALANA